MRKSEIYSYNEIVECTNAERFNQSRVRINSIEDHQLQSLVKRSNGIVIAYEYQLLSGIEIYPDFTLFNDNSKVVVELKNVTSNVRLASEIDKIGYFMPNDIK